MSNDQFLDRVLDLMGVTLSTAGRQHVMGYLATASVWERNYVLLLIMTLPEFQMA